MKIDERHVYGPRPVSVLMPRLTRPAFRRRSPATAQVLADWADIVGPAIAAVTTPRRLSDGTLTIACSGPIAMELQHIAGEVMARINTHLGRQVVTALRFVQTLELSAPLAARVTPARSGEGRGNRGAVGDLPQGEFRGALASLGHAKLTTPNQIEVLMPLSRRSTLSLAGGAAVMGLAGYLGWPNSGPPRSPAAALRRQANRARLTLTGRSPRQGDGHGVLLADLHPLCCVLARDHAAGRKGPDPPGKVRFVYHDFPLDQVALTAAMVARYLPPAQYYPFVSALFASQDRWAFARGANNTEEIWKIAALAGMGRDTFDKAIADSDLRNWILQQQQRDQNSFQIDFDFEFRDRWEEVRWRDELRRVPETTAGRVAEGLPVGGLLLDLEENMPIRRPYSTICSFGWSAGIRGPSARLRASVPLATRRRRTPSSSVSLSPVRIAPISPWSRCRQSGPSGSRRAGYTGCSATSPPTARRCWPRWWRATFQRTSTSHSNRLFASQAVWAYQAASPADALWLQASDAGMDRSTFDHAVADTHLRDWIVSRATDAQTRWNVDATPGFLIDGKLYEGAMSANFHTILGS